MGEPDGARSAGRKRPATRWVSRWLRSRGFTETQIRNLDRTDARALVWNLLGPYSRFALAAYSLTLPAIVVSTRWPDRQGTPSWWWGQVIGPSIALTVVYGFLAVPAFALVRAVARRTGSADVEIFHAVRRIIILKPRTSQQSGLAAALELRAAVDAVRTQAERLGLKEGSLDALVREARTGDRTKTTRQARALALRLYSGELVDFDSPRLTQGLSNRRRLLTGAWNVFVTLAVPVFLAVQFH